MADPRFTILIVDDEALETEGLRRTLAARYGEQVLLHTAATGKAAIALAEETRAEIILMDIEMPGINGLDAARTIKEMNPRCHILMVTAYERFQYAQQAISLGAEEYLLKPVSNDDLFRLIDRAMEDILRDREEASRRAALDQLAREQFVLSILSGYSSVASLENRLSELDISFGYGFFSVLQGMGEDDLPSLYGVFDALQGSENLTILSYLHENRLLACVLLEGPSYDEATLRELVSRWAGQIQVALSPRLRISVGPIVSSLGELQRSYTLAAECMRLCSAETPIQIHVEDMPGSREHMGLERRLYRCLLEKDIDAALRCVDLMFDTLYFCFQQPDAVAKMAREALARVAGRLQGDTRGETDIAGTLAALDGMPPVRQEMVARIRGLLADWVRQMDAQPADRLHHVRAEIERYIQAHYAEDLSIRKVANAMHYSEPYFSKLFTRCFHRNFITYLTDIRMQAARGLLGSSLVNVREVSHAVGFSDANYFAKVFRRAYGISPSEYRRFSAGQMEENA